MRAIWNGVEIANSADTIEVEGNHYFPRESLREEYFRPSETRSHCGWKGEARYLDIVVGADVNPDAAWCYSGPRPAAKEIAGHVAFWRGVKIQ